MKEIDKGICGSNKLSNALNKPISGKLAKQASFKSKFIIFTLVFIAILIFSVSQLGLETGIYFAIGFSMISIIVYFKSKHDLKERDEILEKHPWKAFEDRKK